MINLIPVEVMLFTQDAHHDDNILNVLVNHSGIMINCLHFVSISQDKID